MADSIGIVILAAGKGTRLKVDIPKALCPLQGKPLIGHVLKQLKNFNSKAGFQRSLSVVVGHKKDEVEAAVSKDWPEVDFVWQKEQKGTAHALQCYFEQSGKAWDRDYTLVVCADTPLITSDDYLALYECLKRDGKLNAVAAVFKAANPAGYGRIVEGSEGFETIEEKDASEEQRGIKLVNSGLYLFKTSHIREHLNKVDNKNKSGEFYLTDLFKKDYAVKALPFDNEFQFMGVNNLVQLEEAARAIQILKIKQLQLKGVRFINSLSCYVEEEVEIEAGAVVYPNVALEGRTRIGKNCVIETGVVAKNSTIEEGSMILANSYLEQAHIKQRVKVGPMARIRPGSVIDDDCKIGNFVETKNAKLDRKVSVSHLSYVGDAEIGENTNLGCGFITCNYDGASKHKTIIGKNCFIGSDSQMIAPITLGDDVYVASGSTINQSMPAGSFGIARGRQTTKEGMAKRFLKKKS